MSASASSAAAETLKKEEEKKRKNNIVADDLNRKCFVCLQNLLVQHDDEEETWVYVDVVKVKPHKRLKTENEIETHDIAHYDCVD